jgi:hypothetical protein
MHIRRTSVCVSQYIGSFASAGVGSLLQPLANATISTAAARNTWVAGITVQSSVQTLRM